MMGKCFAPTAVRPTYVLEGTKRPLILLLLSFNRHNNYQLQFQIQREIFTSSTVMRPVPHREELSPENLTLSNDNSDSDEDHGQQGGNNVDCDQTFDASCYSSEPGPVFAHGTTGAKRTVGAPPPYIKVCKENAKLCNIVTATSLLN
jgi:hypothetical protein